jgi:hypothetical protein
MTSGEIVTMSFNKNQFMYIIKKKMFSIKTYMLDQMWQVNCEDCNVRRHRASRVESISLSGQALTQFVDIYEALPYINDQFTVDKNKFCDKHHMVIPKRTLVKRKNHTIFSIHTDVLNKMWNVNCEDCNIRRQRTSGGVVESITLAGDKLKQFIDIYECLPYIKDQFTVDKTKFCEKHHIVICAPLKRKVLKLLPVSSDGVSEIRRVD